MSITGILVGVGFFIILLLISYSLYSKWKVFKNLKPGDTCGCFVEKESSYDFYITEIIKIDTDDSGYTSKIYTKNNAYTLIDCIRNNIYLMCSD